MARSDGGEADLSAAGRSRRQVPLVIRLLVAAMFAAVIAFGASYALRMLNL